MNIIATAFIVLAGVFVFAVLFALYKSFTASLSLSNLHMHSTQLPENEEKLAEKQAVLRHIKDLQFERDVGKISEQDYTRLNAQFRKRARALIHDIDEELDPFHAQASTLLAQQIEEGAHQDEQ